MRTSLLVRALALAFALCACEQPTSAQAQASGSLFADAPDLQWRLPAQLREISGLAVSPDGRLFAHDDEHAVIYELDVAHGSVIKSFNVGESVETGDFEGLAITPAGDFWLVTSKGRLLRFREGADRSRVEFEAFDTGLDDICEIEGLAFLAAEESLILACKRNKARNMRDTVSLHIWRIGAEAATPWVNIPEAEIARVAGVRRFRPSSVDFDASTGRVILLSANNNAVVEISTRGEIFAARALGGDHVQAEGVAVLGGALIVADEGADAPAALLSRYPAAP